MSDRPELLRRAQQYCAANGLLLCESLGGGIQGIVFAVQNQTQKQRSAIKVHEREPSYRMELAVYLRLKEHGVTDVANCAVPQLLRSDDSLWIIEMTIVTRPFVLDFASASLDQPFDLSEQMLAYEQETGQELFESRWPDVLRILRILERYGIFLGDVRPGNISFAD